MNREKYNEVAILLIEDDDVDAMGVRRALKTMKIINPLFRAKDGVEAFQMLKGENPIPRPFLILLDLNMPRMNGLEFLQQLRQDPVLQDSIVFVLTTSKSDEDIVAAYRQHIAGYILKKQVENGFLDMLKMLDHFWRVVEMPILPPNKK